jgi:hypothetical protein
LVTPFELEQNPFAQLVPTQLVVSAVPQAAAA